MPNTLDIPDVNIDLDASFDEKFEKSMDLNVTEFRQRELRGEIPVEPLLKEDKTRFVLFPIKHDDVSVHLDPVSFGASDPTFRSFHFEIFEHNANTNVLFRLHHNCDNLTFIALNI
jgi:hypothetical protein